MYFISFLLAEQQPHITAKDQFRDSTNQPQKYADSISIVDNLTLEMDGERESVKQKRPLEEEKAIEGATKSSY